MSDPVEIEKVRANLDSWLKAFNGKDLDTLFSLYDPESIYANAANPIMEGVDKIRPWYQRALANLKGVLVHKEEAAFQEGNMALLVGAYYFQPPKGEDSHESGATGRVALVYRRGGDGVWRLLFDMDNTPPDVKPEDFN